MNIQLDIYIEPDCLNCDSAFRVAEVVRDRLPEVEVSVIDISQPGTRAPDNVFAVPTYLLNGETWSLGTPDEAELLHHLKQLTST